MPPRPRAAGTVEVWSHLVVADGVELTLEPGRAGLSPEEAREFFRGVLALYREHQEQGTSHERRDRSAAVHPGETMALLRASLPAASRARLLFELAVEQRYRNPTARNIEAVYTFPLPLDAVLLDLEVTLGGKTLKRRGGREEAPAEREYEQAIDKGDTAHHARAAPATASARVNLGQPDGGRGGDDPLPLRATAALRARQRAPDDADGDRAALRRSEGGRPAAAPGADARPRAGATRSR